MCVVECERQCLHRWLTTMLPTQLKPSDHMPTADSLNTTAVGLVKTTLGNQSAPFAQQPCNHSCGTRASLTWVSAGLEMTCTIFTILRTPTKHITPAPTHHLPLDPNRTGQTPHPQRHECPHQSETSETSTTLEHLNGHRVNRAEHTWWKTCPHSRATGKSSPLGLKTTKQSLQHNQTRKRSTDRIRSHECPNILGGKRVESTRAAVWCV